MSRFLFSVRVAVPLLKLWRKLAPGPPPEVPGGNPFRREVVASKRCRARWEDTVARLVLYLPTGSRCLDLGPENPLGKKISETCCCRVEDTGNEDLDTPYWHRNFQRPYDAIFAFEVLEHLFNPLGALLQAKALLSEHGSIYVTVPRRPRWMWAGEHFHEFDAYRLEALFRRAGLKIVRADRFRTARRWTRSVPPMQALRWFTDWIYFAQLRSGEQKCSRGSSKS